MLQPILIDSEYRLIDGVHRLEAARRSGWARIPALICDGATETQWPLIELEANRVRRIPSPLELEAVWRAHYEPEFRAVALQKRRLHLRRGNSTPVLGNTENGASSGSLSIASAAKQTTGLSIETLNKISEIRALAHDQQVEPEVRALARASVQKLARPRASVDGLYRSLARELEMRQSRSSGAAEKSNEVIVSEGHRIRREQCQRQLDRMLEDASLWSERLDGQLGGDLEKLLRSGETDREQLRATRIAFAKSLATLVSIECRLERNQAAALRRIGAEVSRLLSRTSVAQLGIDRR